jgi:hypothetical protein
MDLTKLRNHAHTLTDAAWRVAALDDKQEPMPGGLTSTQYAETLDGFITELLAALADSAAVAPALAAQPPGSQPPAA